MTPDELSEIKKLASTAISHVGVMKVSFTPQTVLRLVHAVERAWEAGRLQAAAGPAVLVQRTERGDSEHVVLADDGRPGCLCVSCQRIRLALVEAGILCRPPPNPGG